MVGFSYRRIAVAGATAAVIVGAGTAALAASGSSGSTSGTPATGAPAASARHNTRHGAGHRPRLRVRRALRHAVHGDVVTKGPDGYVEHSAVVGAVSSVSSTAISVRAADGYTESFVVGTDTKVRLRGSGATRRKATTGAIADVKDGANVAVLGKQAESAHGNPDAVVIVVGVRRR